MNSDDPRLKFEMHFYKMKRFLNVFLILIQYCEILIIFFKFVFPLESILCFKTNNFLNLRGLGKTVSRNQNVFDFETLFLNEPNRYDITNEKYVIFMSYRSNILSYHSSSILFIKTLKIFSFFYFRKVWKISEK